MSRIGYAPVMPPDRPFRVRLPRKIDADDHLALNQAGIGLATDAAEDVLLLRAADQEGARLRIRAALGGHEHLEVQAIDN